MATPGAAGRARRSWAAIRRRRAAWRGLYGVDGYQIVNDSVSYPSYATVTPTGAATWEWAGVTTEVRGLQRAVGSSRLAATFFGTTFGLDITITDGSAHQVSLYVLDWEGRPRPDLRSAGCRDQHAAGHAHRHGLRGRSGTWRWTISGHVVIRAQLTAGANAVVSGVFFDGGGAVNTPPTVTLTAPASGAQFTAPATLAVQATASDGDGIQKVEFYQAAGGGTPTLIGPAVTSPPYQVTWSNVAAGSYTITAKAYDTKNVSSTTSVPITVVPAAGGGQTTATFVGTDTTTQGTWRGVYGLDGYVTAMDATSPPAYATVTPTGAATWEWAGVTTEVRGLQRAVGGSNRFAATFFGTTFGLDITITDGSAHQVSLYVLDWEGYGRAQTFEVRDAVTNTLLDTRTVTAFAGGQFLALDDQRSRGHPRPVDSGRQRGRQRCVFRWRRRREHAADGDVDGAGFGGAVHRARDARGPGDRERRRRHPEGGVLPGRRRRNADVDRAGGDQPAVQHRLEQRGGGELHADGESV